MFYFIHFAFILFKFKKIKFLIFFLIKLQKLYVNKKKKKKIIIRFKIKYTCAIIKKKKK